MVKKIFFSLLLFYNYSTGYSYPPNTAVDVLHYRFRIQLYDTTDVITVAADVQVLFRKAQTHLTLDLVGKDVNNYGMTVHEVTVSDGLAVPFLHQKDRLTLTPIDTPKKGEEYTYTIQYTGIPSDGLIIGNNKFGDRTFFGDNWPNRARYWLSVVDHPSDKARCEFIVTAPNHYQVVSNGVKIEQTNMAENRLLTHWKEEEVIPTKVMVIGVAPFAVAHAGHVGSVPVDTWVFPQNKEDGFSDFLIAPKILDYFQSHIDRYPYQKLANVQSKTRYGGMENASSIFYFENSVTGKREQEDLIAHEIAHQWFGNSVSELDWPHIWLSEGFATYFTNLYIEHTYGYEKMKERMTVQRQQVLEYAKKKRTPVIDTTYTDLNQLLNVNSYQKGAWVLHMLRHELGDPVFWEGIKKFYKTYRSSNASTQQLRKVMEAVSGKDLIVFFNQWLRQSGHPVLSVRWQYRATSKQIDLHITQTQAMLFTTSLDIGVKDVDGTIRFHTVKIKDRIGKFSIPVGRKPLKIILDPHIQLLFEGELKNI